MDGTSFDEIVVFFLPKFLLQLVDGECLFEIDDVVKNVYADSSDVVEKVGIRAIYLVNDIRQSEKRFIGIKKALLCPNEAYESVTQILLDFECDDLLCSR